MSSSSPTRDNRIDTPLTPTIGERHDLADRPTHQADSRQPGPSERRRSRRRRRANRHLRDVLTRGQRLRLGCLIAAWGLLSVWAWQWWFEPQHASSMLALVINSLLLSVEMIVLPGWFFFWTWRMKQPNPDLAPPAVRAAMIVTKAPSEPWPIVRETLEAMLRQVYPYPYDTWLADEDPAPETLAWCEAHGVRVSSRKGVDEYHRPSWPRRTKCKEGNLAYFYDCWGYELYDVVAQLDADHVPAPNYLWHMTGPFRDEMVGYVAAPSICDRNASRSWAARGRLYAEAVLHGPTQAGHSGGFAPVCIGSHYAVRTSALKEIGGIGPELAEDFTTTLMMTSHGWQGVFAVNAEAHGEGPETFADCMTQEFQWSRSMVRVLLGISKHYKRGLRGVTRVRLGFSLWWYPLFGTMMLGSVLVPIIAIVTRSPFMIMPLGSFWAHFGPVTLTLLAAVLWLRVVKRLRPYTARAVSWEMFLFQVVRWPWALIGCIQALAGHVARREFAFKVTPKGREGAAPLPMRFVAPYMLLAILSGAPALLGIDAGRAHGYYALAMLNVIIYMGATMAILGLHVYEHPRSLRREVVRRSVGKLSAALASGMLSVAALGTPGVIISSADSRAAVAAPFPIVSSADSPAAVAAPFPIVSSAGARALTLGVTTYGLASNSYRAWVPVDLGEVNAFEQAARAHAGIVMWYADWAHARPDLAQLNAVAARGSTPEICWEPWNYSGSTRHQPQYTLASIIDGRHDAYIRSWALALTRFHKPVLLRFAQEMNGNWYPWSEQVNGNHQGQFAAAWRHVHDIFNEVGATNVRWVWSPTAGGQDILPETYPGPSYVDVVGLSVFNGGTSLPWGGWRSFAHIFDRSAQVLRAIAPGKPIQISEVGSAEQGGSKAEWIRGMFADLHHQPDVRSIVWYDLHKQTDWPITSSGGAAQAFATAFAQR